MDFWRFQPVGGGTGLDVLERLLAIEVELARIKESVATESSFGLAKITNAQNITNVDCGFALSALQNNAAVQGTLANRTKELEAKTIDRSLLYENSSYIETGETLSLAHSNYDILEVHWRFEPNQYDTRVDYVPKGSHIIVHTIGVSLQNLSDTFFGCRGYVFNSTERYVAGDGLLYRMNGEFNKNNAWFNIVRIYGIKYSQ